MESTNFFPFLAYTNTVKMSSVSKSSRFSSKSQIIIDAQDKTIAEQGGQISEMAREMEAMKQMLVKAGLDLSTQF